jgi:hypothetical protein
VIQPAKMPHRRIASEPVLGPVLGPVFGLRDPFAAPQSPQRRLAGRPFRRDHEGVMTQS